MSEDCVDIDRPSGFIHTSLNLTCVWNSSHHSNRSQEADAAVDAAVVLRICISVVYSLVCALGLVGNVLVLHLMKSKQIWKKSSINLFVTSLALTDLQFVLTLPFWAVENALDFTWLFGNVMCKVVSYVTAMNMYASVFFLTAMSVARYCSLASALRTRVRRRAQCQSPRCVAVCIWLLAVSAALPHAVFSTTVTIADEDLCLVKFPDNNNNKNNSKNNSNSTGQLWFGLYQAQKVLLGFVFPLCVISASYLLLLRFITPKSINNSSAKRRAKVTKSVTIVVLSFFLCWLPNQALTVWGILIKLNVVHFSYEYYTTQAYVFPLSVCLAHSNSCLNPILYCLMRREFRKALRRMFERMTSSRNVTHIRPVTASTRPEAEAGAAGGPAISVSREPAVVVFYPPGVVMYNDRRDLPQNST